MTATQTSQKSDLLFQEACRHLVGGVNSPVRAFQAVGGTPKFIAKAKGPYVIDVDGDAYIDFVGAWGPMILGHAYPAVMKAVKKALKNGFCFGAPTEIETELAKIIKEAFPSIEQIRFTSSGTEATMAALRLARAVTKRQRIVKFEGGYHGHSDGLLVSAGSGATTFGVPSSPGVLEVLATHTWVLPFNNMAALENLFQKQGPNIAAVIIEPVCGNMGVVLPDLDFLKMLRQLTERFGCLLIFDEVMTGFRLAWGGAQHLFGITPDLTCLGKIIGGGFPVGALGGPRRFMELLSPSGPVYHAGTMSGHPVAMAAGAATLTALKFKPPYKKLESATRSLASFIAQCAKKGRLSVQVNHAGSMFTVFFTDQPVNSYFEAGQADAKRYATFFHALLQEGVFMPPSQFEAAFVSAAHTPAVMLKAKQAFEKAFAAVALSI